ncbi:MAG TPA: patatin-like phospholipase family protein [Gemmatimonadales bacterium]|nr:patatin-like phospholipase family protein [Gemmatimonadales bacterium]
MSFTSPFTLVFSGGGLKGLAHIGVLRALEERGLIPSAVIGSSMGSLVAAAWATGMSLKEMTDRALAVRRRDIFQVAHTDMAFKRMRAPAVYRKEPLDHLIHSLVGDVTFHDLPRRLLINTVELNSGMQIFWGLPGLRNARVADAVFASCALPGIFPPREIQGRWFVDGAVTENLPVHVAASHGEGPVMAVDVGSTSAVRSDVQDEGFAATYIRGLEIVMQTIMESKLRRWTSPPLVLVQPRVEHVSMFGFGHNRELIEEGYRATLDLLDALKDFDPQGSGIYPQRRVQIRVDSERCIGCGSCVMHAPWVFELDQAGKAHVIQAVQAWSPIDGAYVRNCPTYAISARLAPPSRHDGTGTPPTPA